MAQKKTANEAANRIVPTNPMEMGDTPEGETEHLWAVTPGDVNPDKERSKELNAPRIDQHNEETEPGQTAPWDELHPGEQKED